MLSEQKAGEKNKPVYAHASNGLFSKTEENERPKRHKAWNPDGDELNSRSTGVWGICSLTVDTCTGALLLRFQKRVSPGTWPASYLFSLLCHCVPQYGHDVQLPSMTKYLSQVQPTHEWHLSSVYHLLFSHNVTHSKWICNNVLVKMTADMFSLCPTWIIRGGVSHRTSLESGVWSMKQEDGPFHSSHRKAAWFM